MPRVGVIGSFVWDVIYGRTPGAAPLQEWGGITYALGAFDAALPPQWQLVPLVKVGSDLWERATQFLATLARLAPDARPIEVPVPNNRVELHYQDDEMRSEVLTGGVPPWSWLGLKPLLRDLDALYVNLISGFELDLETMRLVRRYFSGPIYLDLHSLLLGVAADGRRIPRPLADALEWCACCDLLQVNEQEMQLLAPDAMALAAGALRSGTSAVIVTMGKRGAMYFAASDFDSLAVLRQSGAGFAVRSGFVPAESAGTQWVDPTGCGDVFGATCFSRLLAGDKLGDALRAAARAAARNAAYRGASGLASYLRGEIIAR
jgi:hypothetical protein